jgi:hypothetical protein
VIGNQLHLDTMSSMMMMKTPKAAETKNPFIEAPFTAKKVTYVSSHKVTTSNSASSISGADDFNSLPAAMHHSDSNNKTPTLFDFSQYETSTTTTTTTPQQPRFQHQAAAAVQPVALVGKTKPIMPMSTSLNEIKNSTAVEVYANKSTGGGGISNMSFDDY